MRVEEANVPRMSHECPAFSRDLHAPSIPFRVICWHLSFQDMQR